MKKSKIIGVIITAVFLLFVLCSCDPFKELKRESKGLTEYTIIASYDEGEHCVKGTEKVVFINKTNTILDRLCFNVYGRAFRSESKVKPWTVLNQGKCFPNGVNYGDMQVIKVLINDIIVEFSYNENDALEIVLSEKLDPGEKVSVNIEFNVLLAECTHRLGYFEESVNLGNWFPILAIYENGNFITEAYYSTGDPFYSDVANFMVEFEYPKEYVFSSTGVKNIKENTDTKTAKVKALAVRDFAICLTKNAQEKYVIEGDVTLRYVGYPKDNNMDNSLNIMKKVVRFFSNTFGEYPYQTLDVVKAPFIHGGMEYPSMVIISQNITDDFDYAKVIVHEIAHQWWYAVVGNNQISEAWLDESLAEYSTIMFFEKHNEFGVTYEELISDAFANYTLYADIASTLNKEINTSMRLNVNDYNSEYEYTYMIYVRGVLMFDSIRSVVGEKAIKTALKKYYSAYKFKIAKTDDLIAKINHETRKNVDVVMDSWLNGKTIVGSI